MNLLVANVVEQDRLAAFTTFEARDQVMARLRDALGDGPAANRAQRIGCIRGALHATDMGWKRNAFNIWLSGRVPLG